MNKLPLSQKKHFKFRYCLLGFLILSYVLGSLLFSARDVSFHILTPFIEIEDDNLVLFDYYVYGTERRFNEGLQTEIPKVKNELKEKGEAVIVKIPGKGKRLIFPDYSIIYGNVPELNIEVYVAKNVVWGNASLPFSTVEELLEYYLFFTLRWSFVFFLTGVISLCLSDRIQYIERIKKFF